MSISTQAVEPSWNRTYAADVPPAATSVLARARGLPFPGPIVSLGGLAAGGIIANKLDVGILVKIGVCMKLARDEILQVSARRGIDVGEAIYMCVVVGGAAFLPAEGESEVKDEFIVVAHLEEEARRRQRLGILALRMIR